MDRRITQARPAIRPVVLPSVLLTRKLRDGDFASKSIIAPTFRSSKSDAKLRRMLGILVNRQYRPLFVWSSHRVGGDGRVGRFDCYRINLMRCIYRLHPIVSNQPGAVVG